MLARGFGASDCLDGLLAGLWLWHSVTFLTCGFQRPRPSEAVPAGSEIEPGRGQNDLLEASGSSWGAIGRQMAGQTAPEALLGGAWAGRKRSWAGLGRLREASGGSGEGLREAMWVFLFGGHAEEAGQS